MSNNQFLSKAQEIFHHMREIRRDLHRHPELGLQEKRTSGIVADYLERLGLDVKRGIGSTGVVATLYSQSGAETVSLRADMDALPMADKKDVPYASTIDGAGHCCGHDGHTAMLLGTANLLCDDSDSLKGNVKFIFQPSEEKIPGGRFAHDKERRLKKPGGWRNLFTSFKSRIPGRNGSR